MVSSRVSQSCYAVSLIEQTREREQKKKTHTLSQVVLKLDNGPAVLKDDQASMTAPIYSLSKVKDTRTFEWISADRSKKLRVIPSLEYGRANIYDKAVIIFAISRLVKLRSDRLPISRSIRFSACSYLRETGQSFSAKSYDRLECAIKRLSTTLLETNLLAGKKQVMGIFGLIDQAGFVRDSVSGKLEYVQITLSEWHFNAISALDILTLDKDYFSIKSPLARRIYEIARKHCDNKFSWIINFKTLFFKSGSTATEKEFRRMLKSIIDGAGIPNYDLQFVANGSKIKFSPKDPKKLVKNAVDNLF